VTVSLRYIDRIPRAPLERDNIGHLLRGNPPDLVVVSRSRKYREPKIAIEAGRDSSHGPREGVVTEFGDYPGRVGNPPDDMVAVKFYEPSVAIRAGTVTETY
jgi:hypothetical protein